MSSKVILLMVTLESECDNSNDHAIVLSYRLLFKKKRGLYLCLLAIYFILNILFVFCPYLVACVEFYFLFCWYTPLVFMDIYSGVFSPTNFGWDPIILK